MYTDCDDDDVQMEQEDDDVQMGMSSSCFVRSKRKRSCLMSDKVFRPHSNSRHVDDEALLDKVFGEEPSPRLESENLEAVRQLQPFHDILTQSQDEQFMSNRFQKAPETMNKLQLQPSVWTRNDRLILGNRPLNRYSDAGAKWLAEVQRIQDKTVEAQKRRLLANLLTDLSPLEYEWWKRDLGQHLAVNDAYLREFKGVPGDMDPSSEEFRVWNERQYARQKDEIRSLMNLNRARKAEAKDAEARIHDCQHMHPPNVFTCGVAVPKRLCLASIMGAMDFTYESRVVDIPKVTAPYPRLPERHYDPSLPPEGTIDPLCRTQWSVEFIFDGQE